VKDRFERMWGVSAGEVVRMEAERNEAVRLRQLFAEEMAGMRMLLESRGTELDEANNKLENERDVFRGKISSLREEVNAKEAQILDFHNRQLEDQQVVGRAADRMKSAEAEIAALVEQNLALQADLLHRDRLMLEAALERDSNRALFRELSAKLEESGRAQQASEVGLSGKTAVLEQMRGRADREKELLRRLLESYREERERRGGFVHPMIYEDCRAQIDRNTLKIAALNQAIAALQTEAAAR
jgi:chromosome segregation ATPase